MFSADRRYTNCRTEYLKAICYLIPNRAKVRKHLLQISQTNQHYLYEKQDGYHIKTASLTPLPQHMRLSVCLVGLVSFNL